MAFGSGSNSVCIPLYIREITPVTLTGWTGSYFQLNTGIGCFASSLIALAFEDLTIWPEVINDESLFWYYFLHGMPIIPCVIRLTNLLIFFKSDTPKFYILK